MVGCGGRLSGCRVGAGVGTVTLAALPASAITASGFACSGIGGRVGRLKAAATGAVAVTLVTAEGVAGFCDWLSAAVLATAATFSACVVFSAAATGAVGLCASSVLVVTG